MQIIDLTEQHENMFFHCLEDWSDVMKESGEHKACWYRKIQRVAPIACLSGR
jgi:hypothetical protein